MVACGEKERRSLRTQPLALDVGRRVSSARERLKPVVSLRRNSIRSCRSRRNTSNCSVMPPPHPHPHFFFLLQCPFWPTHTAVLNAARLFLTRPCFTPPPSLPPNTHTCNLLAGNEGYEERRKAGELFEKRKHRGNVCKSPGYDALSSAKRLGDCCVFTNTADEVTAQRGKEYLPTG